jgi:hypothetical protein
VCKPGGMLTSDADARLMADLFKTQPHPSATIAS